MRAEFEIAFDDVDYARVLFHARYYGFVDRAFTAWLHTRGVYYRTLYEELGVAMPIATSHCRYRGPLVLEDRFEVRLAVQNLSPRGFRLAFHVIRLADDFLVAEGYEERRFVDAARRRPAEPPDRFYRTLQGMAEESADHLPAATGG